MAIRMIVNGASCSHRKTWDKYAEDPAYKEAVSMENEDGMAMRLK